MNEDELEVEVVDRRLQVNMDAEDGVSPTGSNNEFMQMPEQGFEVRKVEEEQGEDEGDDE